MERLAILTVNASAIGAPLISSLTRSESLRLLASIGGSDLRVSSGGPKLTWQPTGWLSLSWLLGGLLLLLLLGCWNGSWLTRSWLHRHIRLEQIARLASRVLFRRLAAVFHQKSHSLADSRLHSVRGDALYFVLFGTNWIGLYSYGVSGGANCLDGLLKSLSLDSARKEQLTR